MEHPALWCMGLDISLDNIGVGNFNVIICYPLSMQLNTELKLESVIGLMRYNIFNTR